MADPIRQALERLQQYAAAHPEHDTAELVAAAHAALAAEPPAPAPAADAERDHVLGAGNMVPAAYAARLRQCPTHGQLPANAWGCPECLRELREELARLRAPAADGCAAEPVVRDSSTTAPTPPANEEVEELAQWLEGEANDYDDFYPPESSLKLYRAAALLREARPQPVADRPWERPGWCDAEGRCCWLAPNQSWPCLYLMKVDSALAAQVATHCLPHWFIPIPIPQPPQGDPLMQCGHPNGCTCVLLHGFTHPDPLCAWASAQTQPPEGGEVEA